MYNELIEALDLAGKDDSVITVMTGEVLCFTFQRVIMRFSVCRSFLTLLSTTLKVVGIITAVETT